MAKVPTELEKNKIEEDVRALMLERRRRLSKVMQDNHITLVELEKMTGVAKSSIQRYLTGETSKMPIDFFDKVAIATGTPVDYLTCFDKQKNTSIGTDRGEFAEFLSKLSEQEYEQVKQFAEFISGNK